MGRGTPLDEQTIYNIMASYAVTNNYSETARLLNIPVNTIRDIVKRYKNNDEFVKIREQKKEEFADKCSGIIDDMLQLISRRVTRALTYENEMDKLIESINAFSDNEIPHTTKMSMISKVRDMQLHKMSELTTSLGTLFDKKALAQGESTQNVTFTIPDEVRKYAE